MSKKLTINIFFSMKDNYWQMKIKNVCLKKQKNGPLLKIKSLTEVYLIEKTILLDCAEFLLTNFPIHIKN